MFVFFERMWVGGVGRWESQEKVRIRFLKEMQIEMQFKNKNERIKGFLSDLLAELGWLCSQTRGEVQCFSF